MAWLLLLHLGILQSTRDVESSKWKRTEHNICQLAAVNILQYKVTEVSCAKNLKEVMNIKES